MWKVLPCIVALSFALAQSTPGFPAHWWTPVPESSAASWEILPQAAKPGEVILSKRNELGILSNFAATPFALHGKRYASVEGFWQMMLYPEGPDDPRAKVPGIRWPHTRDEVARMTAFEAKDAGTAAEENMRKMGIDWFPLPFEDARRSLPPDPRSHARQTGTKSARQADPALHGQSGFASRPRRGA